ncbi:hypothetical protein HW555_014063 [Spodoptera exigua]|uniref:Uncharacterized protein n=1 Tax=Spodoptera exigua TaxID=7107 RepID=A0A835KWD5_SPOEX|nr:hypothetical protein HW555_014063 [Spodoptera exigua]
MSKGWILEHNDAAQNRVTLTKGETSDDYILFYQQTCYVPAIPYDFGRCDVVYRGEPNEKIYSIQITSSWPPPSYIHSEGLGTNVGRQHLNLGGYQIETEGVDYAGAVFSASRQVCGCRLTKVYIVVQMLFISSR